MGISGLLPFIKKSCRSANLKDFSGATVAIDAYSWLHKGAFSCAEKLVKGEKTDGYVFYCAKLLNMLLDLGVKPIMIFDGCNLHSKEGTEKKRRENREKTRQRGKELLCEGKLKEARECFQRCVDVTPEMAKEVIEMCRKKSVDYIVAPYEADAQLAYLDRTGMAQIIITEDSDLVLFGCNKILFKMDSCGSGLLYEKENLPQSFGSNASKFTFEKFRYMCILSGCDYLQSLPGIGLAKACKFFMLTCNTDIKSVLKKLPSYLKMPKLEVTDEYIDSFIKAINTFLYQLVFCPQKKCLVPLNPYPDDIDTSDMEYAGKYLPNDIASELAIGNINVKTLKTFTCSESETSFSDIKKDAVWDSIAEVNEKKPISKVESAFKFNSQKVKGIKRKVEANNVDKPQVIDDDEELFSMYRSVNSSVEPDEYEEDPLGDVFEKKPKLSSSFSHVKSESISPKLSSKKLSLKRVVRSRFFVPKEEKSANPSVLRENSPEKKSPVEDLPIVHMDTSLVKKESIKEESENKVLPIVASNKENIAHRFAKKPAVSLQSTSVSSDDITSSLSKVERSWLDVFDNECSSTTVSSNGLATKLLSVDTKDSSDEKTTAESNTVKIKKTKLISTKILDFKWDKETALKKRQLSTQNGSYGVAPEPVVSDDDIEIVLDSTKRQSVETGTSVITNNSLKNTNCDIFDSELCGQDSETPSKSTESYLLTSTQESLTPKTVISSANKLSSSKLVCKPGKCRQIGLSKSRKSSEKKITIKDTLMSFNFVRKSKNELSGT